VFGQGLGLSWRSLIHVLAGNVAGAENDGRAALAALADTGLSGPLLGAVTAVVWALLERGELEQAQDALVGAPAGHGWGGAALRCARSRLLIARHQHTEALAELATIGQQAERAGWRSAGPLPWRALAAQAHLGAGDHAAARRLAHENHEEAERFGSARELGQALRVRGLIEGGAGGIATLERAIERLSGAGAELELARALVDYGAALRRSGERKRSREPLGVGMELAHRSGATALVEHARTELRAAGARPRSVMRSGVDALTPSERRVGALAVDGLTNFEIAQSLFVTVRTVEMHLSAAYGKLGISSRTELENTLVGQGP
jgi:DNA-binding CsgD family transcriptional regulator